MSQEVWSRYLKVYNPLKAGSIDGTDTRPHDKGIERAMEAVYVPTRDIKSDHTKTLFVSKLNPETSEETLYMTFTKYGEIRSLSLVRDIVTGFSKQYAFVEYEMHRDADEACHELDGSYLDNHHIFVDWECSRVLPGWIPRRLGGGFGGKKESGQLRFGGKDRPFQRPIAFGEGKNHRGGRRIDERNSRGRGERDKYYDGGPNRDKPGNADREEKHERGRERDRERRDRGRDSERDRERGGDKDREKDRERGGDRGRERDSGRGRPRGSDMDREKDRERDSERDRERGSVREREEGHRGREHGEHKGRGRTDHREQKKASERAGDHEEGECTSEEEVHQRRKDWRKRRFTEVKVEPDD